MANTYEINFEGEVFECGGDEYILDAAEAAGVEIPYSCRSRSCFSCVCKIQYGFVNQTDGSFLDDYDMASQYMLACVSYPLTNMSIRRAESEFSGRPSCFGSITYSVVNAVGLAGMGAVLA